MAATISGVWVFSSTVLFTGSIVGGNLGPDNYHMYVNGSSYSMKDDKNTVVLTNSCPEVLLSYYLHLDKSNPTVGATNQGLSPDLFVANGTYNFCPSFSKLILYSNNKITFAHDAFFQVPFGYTGIVFQFGNSTSQAARAAVNTIIGGNFDEACGGANCNGVNAEKQYWTLFQMNCNEPSTMGDNYIQDVHWYDAHTGIQWNFTHNTACNNNHFDRDYGTNTKVMVDYNFSNAEGPQLGGDGPSNTMYNEMVYEGNFNSKYFWVYRNVQGTETTFFENYAYDYVNQAGGHPAGCTRYVTCNNSIGQNTTQIGPNATVTYFISGNVDCQANYTDLSSAIFPGQTSSSTRYLTNCHNFGSKHYTTDPPTATQNLQIGEFWNTAKNWRWYGSDQLIHTAMDLDTTQTNSGVKTMSGTVKQTGKFQITDTKLIIQNAADSWASTFKTLVAGSNNTIPIPGCTGTCNIRLSDNYNSTGGQLAANYTISGKLAGAMTGNYATIYPKFADNFTVTAFGNFQQTTNLDGCRFEIRTSTSNLGVAGATPTGTVVGPLVSGASAQRYTNQTSFDSSTFYISGTTATLTANTKQYFDLDVATITGGACKIFTQNWEIHPAN